MPDFGDVGVTRSSLKCSIEFCCRRADYFDKLEDDLDSLKSKAERLRKMEQEIRKLQPTCKVTDWLQCASDLQKKAGVYIKEGDREMEYKCLRFCIPRCFCSFNRIGYRVDKLNHDIDDALKSCNFDVVVERNPRHNSRPKRRIGGLGRLSNRDHRRLENDVPAELHEG